MLKEVEKMTVDRHLSLSVTRNENCSNLNLQNILSANSNEMKDFVNLNYKIEL